MRDSLGRGFWLKRHGISLGEVFDHRDFLLADLAGNALYGDDDKLHSEWPIHAEIMKRRPDALRASAVVFHAPSRDVVFHAPSRDVVFHAPSRDDMNQALFKSLRA